MELNHSTKYLRIHSVVRGKRMSRLGEFSVGGVLEPGPTAHTPPLPCTGDGLTLARWEDSHHRNGQTSIIKAFPLKDRD